MSCLSTDSTATDNRIPKFNMNFEFFKSYYVFVFAWNLIPRNTSFKHSPCLPY